MCISLSVCFWGLKDYQETALRSSLKEGGYIIDERRHIDEVAELANEKRTACVFVCASLNKSIPTQLVEKIKKLGPSVQFIMVAHNPQIDGVVDAILSGFTDVLAEPLDPALLKKAICRAYENAEGDQRIKRLSLRELEVLRLLIYGLPNKRVANELGISHRTVEVYRAKIMDKLSVRSFAELVSIATKSRHLDNAAFSKQPIEAFLSEV